MFTNLPYIWIESKIEAEIANGGRDKVQNPLDQTLLFLKLDETEELVSINQVFAKPQNKKEKLRKASCDKVP